jgi:mRNA-degrading endonuclease RelE of RelBE toxin-antitoxin system
MNLEYSKASLKYLKKLERAVCSAIMDAIDELPEKGDIRKMRGRVIRNLYRLRVGRYRVLFLWEGETIKILDVDTRGDIYTSPAS